MKRRRQIMQSILSVLSRKNAKYTFNWQVKPKIEPMNPSGICRTFSAWLLEKGFMEELIRRGDVIKALLADNECIEECEAKAVMVRLDEVLDVIRDVSYADRPTSWIPCSERLPEENITVLVSIKDEWEKQRRIEFGRISSEHWEWLNESGVDYWAPAWDNSIDAWMPLPEPWGGADNDNQ